MPSTECPSDWVKDDEDERWFRIDGVEVRRESGITLNDYSIRDRTGCALMTYYPRRVAVKRLFKTPAGAMEAADRHWPLKSAVHA